MTAKPDYVPEDVWLLTAGYFSPMGSGSNLLAAGYLAMLKKQGWEFISAKELKELRNLYKGD